MVNDVNHKVLNCVVTNRLSVVWYFLFNCILSIKCVYSRDNLPNETKHNVKCIIHQCNYDICDLALIQPFGVFDIVRAFFPHHTVHITAFFKYQHFRGTLKQKNYDFF